MPTYGFICTNMSCLNSFTVHRSASESHLITFCPKCESIAERDGNDYKRIRLKRVRATLPQEAFEASPESPDHVHGDGCSCALNKDWHAYVKARLAEDAHAEDAN
ncbi:MAG: hypothetical protein ACK5T0_07710 [Vampirovibrionales bacterium]|jgi:hypothetical protein